MHFKKILFVLFTLCLFVSGKASDNKPNIIIILADDLGYGDVHALNNKSKIPTPNMDLLASDGMVFTDAHSGSAVCTPSRYGLLTGRYCWRTQKKRGVLNGYSPHLIDPERTTIADLFQKSGYTTACIGKWHLGMDFPFIKEEPSRPEGEFYLDTKGKIKNSPNENGFDYFYGISASLDFPPYIFIQNDTFINSSNKIFEASGFPGYMRKGEGDSLFVHQNCLDTITQKAKAFIKMNKDKPFFLYFPITAPHKPVVPHQRFRGNTQLGQYGDFVTQVDWTVGQIMEQLKQVNLDKNTILILTSDNASFMRHAGEDPKFPVGHVQDSTMEAYSKEVHTSNYLFRGTKADIWEGGHRVPFLVRWPSKVKPGTVCNATICLTDLFATAAELNGMEFNRNDEGEDSFSFLPALFGDHYRRTESVINHSSGGMFAIRNNEWKLVLGNGSGGRQEPKGNPFEGPYRLYNLKSDIGESTNVHDQNPEIVKKMLYEFDQIYNRSEIPINHKMKTK